jgi:hypothetical protein
MHFYSGRPMHLLSGVDICLIKLAGRVTELVTRIKIALPTAYPYQIGFATLAGRIATLPP